MDEHLGQRALVKDALYEMLINNEKHLHHGFLVPLFIQYVPNVYFIIFWWYPTILKMQIMVSHFNAIFIKIGILISFKPAFAS